MCAASDGNQICPNCVRVGSRWAAPDIADAAPRGATSAAFKPARIGGPSPAGLECHAASTANRFAAADLTLMRSLRSSENLLVFREVAQSLCSAGNRLPVLNFTYKQGFPACQQVFAKMPIFAPVRPVRGRRVCCRPVVAEPRRNEAIGRRQRKKMTRRGPLKLPARPAASTINTSPPRCCVKET